MKFSDRTIKILRSYKDINQSILFKKGNELSTISTAGTIYAKATIDENIPLDFAIYDLGRFLSCLSLFKEPEIEFEEHKLLIKSGKSVIKYVYARPELVFSDLLRNKLYKNIILPSYDVRFELSTDVYASCMKAMSILSTVDLIISGEDGNLMLKTLDSKNSTTDSYSIEIGNTTKDFRVSLKNENLKIIDDNYYVSVYFAGICHFKSSNIEYYIAANKVE